MQELNDFFNDGFGWVCRHCFRPETSDPDDRPSHWMTEGEAESKTPEMANKALARWADPAQRILECPRCGRTELADLA